MSFTAELFQIADAVRADLAAQEFLGDVAPAFAAHPVFDLSDLATVAIKVYVLPHGFADSLATRNAQWHDNDVDIVVIKKMTLVNGQFDIGELDQMAFLDQQIGKHFAQAALSDCPWAKWYRSQWILPDFAVVGLDSTSDLYKSGLRITYRTLR